MSQFSVMFVCLGNICRSPLAEGIFKHLVDQRGLAGRFHIESSGTGSWHVGEGAHVESVKVAKKHGVSLQAHKAQQLSKSHIESFDLLVAMDRDNRKNVKNKARNQDLRLICLRDFDPDAEDLDVPDPYYLPNDAFQEVYDIIHRSCSNLLDNLEAELV